MSDANYFAYPVLQVYNYYLLSITTRFKPTYFKQQGI